MKKFKISHVFIYLLLILLTLICVVPFYIMVINATHSTNELYTGLSVVPGKYLLDNLRNMLSMVNMPRGFLNSAIVSFSSTFLSIYFGAMTAFGLFEYKFKLKKVIYVILMVSMMVPGQLGIIGLFKLCNNLGLLNTYWQDLLAGIYQTLNTLLPALVDFSMGAATSIYNVFSGLIISIYLLTGKDKLIRTFKKMLYAFLPDRWADYIMHVGHVANRSFGGFLTGQIIDSAIVGLLCFLGMSVM